MTPFMPAITIPHGRNAFKQKIQDGAKENVSYCIRGQIRYNDINKKSHVDKIQKETQPWESLKKQDHCRHCRR